MLETGISCMERFIDLWLLEVWLVVQELRLTRVGSYQDIEEVRETRDIGEVGEIWCLHSKEKLVLDLLV